jgi:oligopeptide/dipeptide ABC transporter ATP-binding protein
MSSVPPLSATPAESLHAVAGAPPDPGSWPVGCRFAARCFLRAKLGNPEICETVDPPLNDVGPSHRSACHFAEQTGEIERGLSERVEEQVTATARAEEDRTVQAPISGEVDPLAGRGADAAGGSES